MTNEQAINTLVRSPAGQRLLRKIEREDQAESLAARRELVAELARLDAERAKVLPALQADEAEAATHLDDARRALAAAKAEYGYARRQRSDAAMMYDAARNRIVGKLRASAPAAIDERLAELRQAFQRARSDDRLQGVRRQELAFIRAKIARLEEMKCEAVADVAAELSRVSYPAV